MSLSTALALLGGAVLLALALHAWWSLRRAQPRQVLAPVSVPGEERVEPSLGGELADGAQAPAVPRHATRRAARLDPLIDAVVTLTLEQPVSGELLLAHLPGTRRAGSKPLHIEGLDSETGDWAAPTSGRHYGELQAGVQLTNRSGALNEIEYSEFVQKVQAFADAVGASAELPDMLEVVARARELDNLAGPLDAQLTVTLRASGVAWSVGYVQQVAGRLGFVPGALPGRLVMPAAEEGAPPVLVLVLDAQAALASAAGDEQSHPLRECTLVLDVPQTPAAAEPFPAWHRAVTALAEELDATACDDHGTPVTLAAFAAIGRELEQLYQRLEALDLAAGSPAARRLFS